MSMNPNTLSQNPGFTEVFFRSEDVEDIIASKKCSGIRFYNMFEDSKVNLMAVAIRGNADMNRWRPFSKNQFYSVSKGLNTTADKIKKKEAKALVKALDDRKKEYRYCVHFDKPAVRYLLKIPGVEAIRVSPANNMNGELSMKIEAYISPKKTPGKAETDSKKKSDDEDNNSSNQPKSMFISAPHSGSFIAITPCPPYCGLNGDDYVY